MTDSENRVSADAAVSQSANTGAAHELGAPARNGAVDLLRIVFSILVILFHSANVLALVGVSPRIVPSGYLAVEFFLIVSGWLLTAKAAKNKNPNVWNADLSMLRGKLLHLFPFIFVATVFSNIFSFIGDYFGSSIFLVDFVGKRLVYTVSELLGLQMLGFDGFWATGTVWFISALLASSFIIYPFLIKRREAFTKYFAPIAALFIYGYISHEWQTLADPGTWETFVYRGLVRAFAGICVGCCAYELTSWLNKSSVRRSTVFLLESCGSVAVILFCIFYRGSAESATGAFFVPPILFLTVSALFSEKSVLSRAIKGKAFTFLGQFSLSTYLNHFYVDKFIKVMAGYFTSDAQMLTVYFLLIVVLSVLNYALGSLLAKKMTVRLMVILCCVIVLLGCAALIAAKIIVA
ncbi:MAG: acyltransferase family protein [Clostridia bacterium]|nr:acyltransferase family protein [Clostridia bacterium]